MTSAAVSVVICTIGRPALLEQALVSLGRCDPAPAEIVVIDQSEDASAAAVVERAGIPGARSVPCRPAGRGRARNEGLRQASQPVVLMTDDDCEVREDWVGVAQRAMAERPGGIVSGQVLEAGGDPRMTPSLHRLDEPRDYTGRLLCGVLYTGNMAGPREAMLALGGFDEHISPAAEDCDFCYRWLRAGRPLRHVPELVVRHHDWRTPAALADLYTGYYVGQGMFYAKHLRAGDRGVLRFVLADAVSWLSSLAAGLRGVPAWSDPRRAIPRGLPRGLLAGWQQFRP